MKRAYPWIPVSVVLPEPNKAVQVKALPYIKPNTPIMKYVAQSDGTGFWDDYAEEILQDMEVVAWRPLNAGRRSRK